MRVLRNHVTREEVIRSYVEYDRRKKEEGRLPPDLDQWPWDSPIELDSKLRANNLKEGVLTAYRDWQFAELNLSDILKCAIFNGIFRGEPQALCQLLLIGRVGSWAPDRETGWFNSIRTGAALNPDSPLIIRPSVRCEAPAEWYLEDGSGRALALLQRILGQGEFNRTAWAYVGTEPDIRSSFIATRPESRQVRRN
jgi:hypothetical protein